MPPKFCSNLSFMFNENSNLLERYRLAKEAGFKGVECAYPKGFQVDEIVDAKKKYNLQQVLINVYVEDGEFGYAALPGKEEQFQNSLNKTVELAKALQCPKIHIMAGKINGEVTKAHHDIYEKNLIYAENILSAANIVGVIEPINPYSLPNYYLTDYDLAINLIKKINSSHIKLQLDIFHLQLLRGDLTHSIKRMLPFTGHVQIAQSPDRGEPNSFGEINYKYILKLLENEGYNDWIGLEYKPVRSTVEGLNWFKEFEYTL